MNKKLNILVIGVSGNVSIGILKALRNSDLKDIILYGACVKKNSAGFAYSDYAMLCPLAFDPEFPNWLATVVKNHDLDVVVSGVEEVNYVLSTIKEKQNKAIYLAPEYENVSIFNDKLKTIHWFKKNKIEHPVTLDLDDAEDLSKMGSVLTFPLIVKPKLGKGSKGLSVITDMAQIQSYVDKGGYIAQELIGTPESEYTCGVYKSKFGYTEVIVMRRELVNGSTATAEVVQNDAIERYCHTIASLMDTTCPFNVQLRLSGDDRPCCFEINMRLSGTTSIRHSFGFKDCEAWLRESVFDQDLRELFKVTPGIAVRYEEEAYFKKDSLDQLRLDGSVDVKKDLII